MSEEAKRILGIDIYNQVAGRLGPEAAEVLAQVADDPSLSGHVLIAKQPSADGVRGTHILEQCYENRQPLSSLGEGLRQTLSGLGALLSFRSLPPEAVPPRKSSDLLVPGCVDLINVKSTMARKMTLVEFDTPRLRALCSLVQVGREVVGILFRVTNLAVANLAVWENEAFAILQQSMNLIRPATGQDGELAEALATALKCVYGPAAQAAETTREKQADRERMKGQLEEKVRTTAREEAREEFTRDMHALITTLRRTDPDPEKK